MNLKAVRIKLAELEMSQTELAERIDVNRSSLSKNLNNKCETSVTTLKKLCDVLKADPKEIW